MKREHPDPPPVCAGEAATLEGQQPLARPSPGPAGALPADVLSRLSVDTVTHLLSGVVKATERPAAAAYLHRELGLILAEAAGSGPGAAGGAKPCGAWDGAETRLTGLLPLVRRDLDAAVAMLEGAANAEVPCLPEDAYLGSLSSVTAAMEPGPAASRFVGGVDGKRGRGDEERRGPKNWMLSCENGLLPGPEGGRAPALHCNPFHQLAPSLPTTPPHVCVCPPQSPTRSNPQTPPTPPPRHPDESPCAPTPADHRLFTSALRVANQCLGMLLTSPAGDGVLTQTTAFMQAFQADRSQSASSGVGPGGVDPQRSWSPAPVPRCGH